MRCGLIAELARGPLRWRYPTHAEVTHWKSVPRRLATEQACVYVAGPQPGGSTGV